MKYDHPVRESGNYRAMPRILQIAVARQESSNVDEMATQMIRGRWRARVRACMRRSGQNVYKIGVHP